MCGRYSLQSDLEDLQRRSEFLQSDLTCSPSYNIIPTQPVLAVTSGDGRRAACFHWGFIPSWSKSAATGNRLTNARAGSVYFWSMRGYRLRYGYGGGEDRS